MKSKKNKGGVRSFHSPLSAHRRQGKQLIPPLMQIENRAPVSWINDQMPEMVWVALICAQTDRAKHLEVMRRFCNLCQPFSDQAQGVELDWNPTLTSMAQLPQAILGNVGRALDDARVPREVLSPLLLFEELPGRARWEELIPPLAEDGTEQAWQCLGSAVADVLDHQSQTATDIRWMNVMFKVVLGKIIFRAGADDEFTEELRLYPDKGDMRRVRPRVRAMEIAFRQGPQGREPAANPWCAPFWNQCLRDTVCMPAPPAEPHDPDVDREAIPAELEQARRALLDHWANSLSTTAIDARHDTAFGLAFYALACLSEAAAGPMSRLVTGRLLVRTLTELRITLAFLVRKGDAETWTRFRSYGSGQAKLALLKYEMLDGRQPSLVRPETLEALANEDFFQEFVNIDLGSWSGLDLRKMAEQSGTKDDYDRFYGWTSTFVHGQWAAVRDAVFATCLNPLHRVHRVPMPVQRPMESSVPDAVGLCNGILETVNEAYPGFEFRLRPEP
jgi:hypothetical protein